MFKQDNLTGYFVCSGIWIYLSLIFGCNYWQGLEVARYSFPQGVASGDPQPEAIMLWTRVATSGKQIDKVDVNIEIATSNTFEKIVKTDKGVGYAKDDFTFRYYATELEPGTTYFYRFICGRDTSRTGRTFTAPSENKAASLNFATLACSSYEQGFYGTLKRLIEEDKSKPEAKQIQLIFHLGDFIYEVVGDDPRHDNHTPNWLVDVTGDFRDIKPFPQGKQWPDNEHWKSGSWSPITVDDYRHLYKTYLSNAVMQEARARWPFVYTWDDHEFADGNYQANTYIKDHLKMEGMQKVKVASNQAWFEYMPATLSQALSISFIKNPAYDFKYIDVENAPIGENKRGGLFLEPNNLKAIQSMAMYRTLQWGTDIVIIVTDTKSYQLPGESVLGEQQKKWFKSLLEQSTAKWKLWANSEPILAAYIDYDNIPNSDRDRTLVYKDSWKTAGEEREEILSFIKEKKISGVVSLSGDYHIQMAATVATEDNTSVMADFAVTAMSAFPDFFWLERKGKSLGDSLLYKLFAYPANNEQLLPNINTTVMWGALAGLELAITNDFEKAIKKVDSTVNPGLKYFDCEHNGYLTGNLNEKRLSVAFINTNSARVDYEQNGAPIVSTVCLELPFWEGGTQPKLSVPIIDGVVFPEQQ